MGELRLIPPGGGAGNGAAAEASRRRNSGGRRRGRWGRPAWDRRGLRALASVDLKKNEEGLIRLAARLQVPFLTFSAEELNRLPGEYSSSDFVKRTAGGGLRLRAGQPWRRPAWGGGRGTSRGGGKEGLRAGDRGWWRRPASRPSGHKPLRQEKDDSDRHYHIWRDQRGEETGRVLRCPEDPGGQ